MVLVDAELEVRAVKKCPIRGMGNGKQRTQLEAVVRAPEILIVAIQRQI